MTIKTPHQVAKAGGYPTSIGWAVDRGKGKTEIIKSVKISADEIAEWYGDQAPVLQTLNEAPSIERAVTEAEVHHHYGHSEEEYDEQEEE